MCEACEGPKARSLLNYNRKRRYGITSAEWEVRFKAQGNQCAICRADSPGRNCHWHTDHDHASGAVRGILCVACNLMLGYARDNPALLESAREYLMDSAKKVRAA